MGIYTVTRQIGIDMAHRVPTHGSKCKNLHGHRYEIYATVESRRLHTGGEQTDMNLDFGFLKQVMMEQIDTPCDHGLCMWVDDPFLHHFVNQAATANDIRFTVGRTGYWSGQGNFGKLHIIPFIPTAERLAEHWFRLMKDDIVNLSKGLGYLSEVTVYETPFCHATYKPAGVP